MGLNFIDTALAYGEGHSERLVGEIARSAREPVYIATKVPPKNLFWPARPAIGIEDVFPYEHILSSTEQSLRNLKADTIDLQQLHVWNPEWIARDEWRRGFEELKRSGKVQIRRYLDQRSSTRFGARSDSHGSDRYGPGDLQRVRSVA